MNKEKQFIKSMDETVESIKKRYASLEGLTVEELEFSINGKVITDNSKTFRQLGLRPKEEKIQLTIIEDDVEDNTKEFEEIVQDITKKFVISKHSSTARSRKSLKEEKKKAMGHTQSTTDTAFIKSLQESFRKIKRTQKIIFKQEQERPSPNIYPEDEIQCAFQAFEDWQNSENLNQIEEPAYDLFDEEKMDNNIQSKEMSVVFRFIAKIKQDVTKTISERKEIFSIIKAACNGKSFSNKTAPIESKPKGIIVSPQNLTLQENLHPVAKEEKYINSTIHSQFQPNSTVIPNIYNPQKNPPVSSTVSPSSPTPSFHLLKNVAQKMKENSVFFEYVMIQLQKKHYSLYEFIQKSREQFFQLAERGQLDQLLLQKSVEERDIMALRNLGFPEEICRNSYLRNNKNLSLAAKELKKMKIADVF